jgi:integrating conjugative element membrane protein (TIGR03747 family)
MAVATKQRPTKKSSWLKRVIVSLFCLAFLGWVALMCWALISWTSLGFYPTYQKIESLSEKQVSVVREFAGASCALWLAERVNSVFLMQQAQEKGVQLSQKAQENVGRLIEEGQAFIAPELRQVMDEFVQKAAQFWLLLRVTGHLLLIKLTILVTAIPLFLLAITAGLIDGLNQRAIRTASLGRESTYIFHKSIPIARKAFFWVLGLWLAMPHAISPTPIFLSLSLLLALLVSVTSSRFKKYL